MNLPASSELYRGSGSSCDELRVMRPTTKLLRMSMTQVRKGSARPVRRPPLARRGEGSRAWSSRPFGAIAAAGLATILYAGGVQRAADHLVAHARQVANTTAAHQHDRVFLQGMPFARDVDRDFLAVGESHARDLA